MHRISFLGFALAAAGLCHALPAQATSVAKARDHNPELACAAVQELIDDLKAGKPFGENGRNFRMFYTDEFGLVEPDEREAFLHSMVSANGKRDRSPIKLFTLFRLDVKDSRALYLAGFSRYSWALKRYVPNGMLLEDEIDDPHWKVQTTYWLLGFRTNDVVTMREAGDAYMLMSDDNRVSGC